MFRIIERQVGVWGIKFCLRIVLRGASRINSWRRPFVLLFWRDSNFFINLLYSFRLPRRKFVFSLLALHTNRRLIFCHNRLVMRCGWFLLALVVVVISIAVPLVILDDDPVDWRIKYLLDPMSTTRFLNLIQTC